MHTVTINIAASGTALNEGGKSFAGHMWYSLDNGDSTSSASYGFAPDPESFGLPFLKSGAVTPKDDGNYKAPYYQKTVEISDAQYAALQSFGNDPTSYQFSTFYNALANSCVDFVWKALEVAGINTTGFEGNVLPTSNKDAIDALLSTYQANLSNPGNGPPDTGSGSGANLNNVFDNDGRIVTSSVVKQGTDHGFQDAMSP